MPDQQQEQIADFYDDFAARQRRIGLNDRIWYLYDRLRGLGLTPDSRVLELGCGVGALTALLARHAKRGYIEAVDLSPESVRFVREQLGGLANVSLQVHDVVTYEPTSRAFDFITLFDVIEHIPLDQHGALFQHVARLADPHTTLLINIPHPALIGYYQQHDPAALQVIDQPVLLAPLVAQLTAAGWALHTLATYSLWRADDYQFLVIRRAQPFTNEPVRRNAWTRARAKAWRLWRAWGVR
ncbi:MAG: class I SAM-dependent methyltransferase [Hymenobacteraceae bacterium]|nr:class I SAM-dependent methyltransferase [Hymenobacteraceae bacterium]